MKKFREFHDNESKNITGESIGVAVLIREWRLLTFLSQMWRLFEGGAYSSKYGARLCPPVCLQVFPSITKLSFFYKLLFPSLDFDLWGHFFIQVADFLRKVFLFAKETTLPANEAHHLWAAD